MSLPPAFVLLPDLALRPLGGAVIWANDESFAEKENLILASAPTHHAATFGHQGQVYDGWETRRRREPGHDTAIIRLGVPGVVRGVMVDTAFFTGNYPPEISVDGLERDGYPSADEVVAASGWTTLVPRSPVAGDTRTPFEVDSDDRWTHVRLHIYPDGGVARLRVHGEGRPGVLAPGPRDLAALENGGLVADCSNHFYSAPQQLLFPGPPRTMGEGWETARRRVEGNEWVRVRLAAEGVVQVAEIDTSCFLHNSPGSASITGFRPDGSDVELLARTPLQPDTRHRFAVATAEPVTHARLDIYPDGGVARLRLWGTV